MPIEVFDLEQLAKKIQLLKFLTDDTREVGATIGPLKIYEDVRFLADSGLDYVCILESVYHRLDPAGALCLSRGSSNIETALKAAKDSGTRVRIQFAGSATTSEDIHDCFRGGVAAVCIDGYLAARALGTQTNDSLGSFLGYATPTPSQTLWIRKELEQLTAELEDWDAFFHRRSFA